MGLSYEDLIEPFQDVGLDARAARISARLRDHAGAPFLP